jgi:hypothetical protein
MSYASLMVHVDVDAGLAGRIGVAADLAEWAFGGVTRDLLAESPICCLFSH